MKRSLGKILLFIGGLLFFVFAVVMLVGLVSSLINNMAVYFNSGTSGIIAFVILLLWILLDLFGGFSGMTYALADKNKGMVRILVAVILILLVLNIVDAIILEISSKTFAWGDWSSVVYGGIPGILYVLGYLLEAKKK
jgi:hypothetical protein